MVFSGELSYSFDSVQPVGTIHCGVLLQAQGLTEICCSDYINNIIFFYGAELMYGTLIFGIVLSGSYFCYAAIYYNSQSALAITCTGYTVSAKNAPPPKHVKI